MLINLNAVTSMTGRHLNQTITFLETYSCF